MSEQEMNTYRFGIGEEPTDEMLEQVMREVAEEARLLSRLTNGAVAKMYATEIPEWAQAILPD